MVELTFFGGDVKSWTNFNTFESEKNNIKHLQNHHPQKGSQSLLESMPRLPFLPPHSLPDPEVNYLAAGRPEKGTWCFQVAWMTQHLLTGPPPQVHVPSGRGRVNATQSVAFCDAPCRHEHTTVGGHTGLWPPVLLLLSRSQARLLPFMLWGNLAAVSS